MDSFQNAGADVLVIAGDLMEARHGYDLDWALRAFGSRWEDVVLIAGNHELFGTTFQDGMDILKEKCSKLSNVYFLDNESAEIGGVVFYGGTSWYKDPAGDPIAENAKRFMADFHAIRGLEPAIYESRRRFIEGLAGADADVVVAHHLPSYRCVAPQYVGSALNNFFVSEVLDEEECSAQLYLFGHTHSQVDLTIGETRCISNPLGYRNEPKSQAAFQDALVLTVEPRRPTCKGCGNEIDPDTCHCGEPTSIYAHDNHGPVPMGCTCLYDRSL